MDNLSYYAYIYVCQVCMHNIYVTWSLKKGFNQVNHYLGST